MKIVIVMKKKLTLGDYDDNQYCLMSPPTLCTFLSCSNYTIRSMRMSNINQLCC